MPSQLTHSIRKRGIYETGTMELESPEELLVQLADVSIQPRKTAEFQAAQA
jgi:hypothetical protein